MTPVPDEAALTVEGLCAGYGGGDILHDVSFTVPEGGITCIVGPNGAGKSTLLASISGLLRPRRGRVLLRGEPVTGRSPRQVLAMGMVHVPQHHSLFRDMTVAENLDLGGYTISDRRLLARAARRGARDVPRRGGVGAEEGGQPVRRPAAAGRVRPVPHARSVPDHPGRALHGAGAEGAALGVRRGPMMNAAGKTVLLVEQNARAGLRLSTHGVVLENGRVRLAGTGREVLENPEIGALYLGGGTGTASDSAVLP